jgi:hypothetical protein
MIDSPHLILTRTESLPIWCAILLIGSACTKTGVSAGICINYQNFHRVILQV